MTSFELTQLISILERIASALEKNMPSQYASELDIAIQEQKQRIDKAKSTLSFLRETKITNAMLRVLNQIQNKEKDSSKEKVFEAEIDRIISWLPKAEEHYHELLIARSKV